jgi:hypothetical protein
MKRTEIDGKKEKLQTAITSFTLFLLGIKIEGGGCTGSGIQIVRGIEEHLNIFDEFPTHLKGSDSIGKIYSEMERIALNCSFSALTVEIMRKWHEMETFQNDRPTNHVKEERNVSEGLESDLKPLQMEHQPKDMSDLLDILKFMYGDRPHKPKLYEFFAAILVSLRSFATSQFFKAFVVLISSICEFIGRTQKIDVLDSEEYFPLTPFSELSKLQDTLFIQRTIFEDAETTFDWRSDLGLVSRLINSLYTIFHEFNCAFA